MQLLLFCSNIMYLTVYNVILSLYLVYIPWQFGINITFAIFDVIIFYGFNYFLCGSVRKNVYNKKDYTHTKHYYRHFVRNHIFCKLGSHNPHTNNTYIVNFSRTVVCHSPGRNRKPFICAYSFFLCVYYLLPVGMALQIGKSIVWIKQNLTACGYKSYSAVYVVLYVL